MLFLPLNSLWDTNILIFLMFHLDGVPKEGLRIQDVLIRIAVLLLIRDKVSCYYVYFPVILS